MNYRIEQLASVFLSRLKRRKDEILVMAEEIKKTTIPTKKEEMDPQEKSFKRRKDMIKNFIIIFLVVMLVLTFFSNTIMNYSLPRVAVQYIQPGSITSVIRGEGTVESGDPYSVMVKQQKTVSRILVKVGAVVHEGDVLVSLEGEDSEELKTAKDKLKEAEDALDTAKEAYNKALLSDEVTNAIIASSQGELNIDELRNRITNAQAAVDAAERDVKDCQNNYDAINNQISITSAAYVSEASKSQVEKLKTDYENAKTVLEEASANLETAKTNLTNAENALSAAKSAVQIALDEKDAAQKELEALQAFKDLKDKKQLHNEDPANPDLTEEEQEEFDTTIAADNEILTEIENRITVAQANLVSATTVYNDAVSAEPAAIAAAEAELKTASEAKDAAQTAFDNANTACENAKKAYEDAQAQVNSGEINNADTLSNLKYQLEVAGISLANAKNVLTEREENLKEIVGDIAQMETLNSLLKDIGKKREDVDKQKEEVAKIETESSAEDVKSPINGTILSVNVTSGKKTSLDDPVVTIQPEGQGYTMSFSVDNDKAKTITVGDEATVTNSWWYNDVTGVVATVRPDPNDANRKKLVTLNLQGSLTAGQTLTMSINSKTSNYDMIVPSSALKNDNKGDYVLVVESKSSPLGNRYFAIRYDVEILATDDIQTAIKGAFEGYEPVVTTATKDITEGQQIMLSEN